MTSVNILGSLVLAAFALAVYLVLSRSIPQGSTDAANVMLGTLGAMALTVVQYTFGSSAGSAAKAAQLAEAQKTLLEKTNPQA
jgi:glycopeptide antibiotics resistance protein